MKPIAHTLCLLVSSFLLFIPTACKKVSPTLIGTFAIEDEGRLKEFLRVEKSGDKYLVSERDRRKWLPPVEVEPIEKEDVERILNSPLETDVKGLGNESLAIILVPVGWKSGPFQSKTGVWLASSIGAFDLYKEPQQN